MIERVRYDANDPVSDCGCGLLISSIIHLSILYYYTSSHQSTMASASGYNHHRFSRAVLKKSRKWEASLTLEFHSNTWKFEHSVCPLPLLIKDKLTSGNDIHV
jgi:hypothetical protein